MAKIRSHVFRGKRYHIKHMAPSKLKKLQPVNKNRVGLCDAPFEQDKTIFIDKTLVGMEELDTYIHEGMHASLWDLDEEAVRQTATDIAKFLWKLGYRKAE